MHQDTPQKSPRSLTVARAIYGPSAHGLQEIEGIHSEKGEEPLSRHHSLLQVESFYF